MKQRSIIGDGCSVCAMSQAALSTIIRWRTIYAESGRINIPLRKISAMETWSFGILERFNNTWCSCEYPLWFQMGYGHGTPVRSADYTIRSAMCP